MIIAGRPIAIAARCGVAVAVLLFVQIAAAPAQSVNPGQDTVNLPKLELSEGQKNTIFISVTNQNFKNETPPNFQPRIGVTVPENVTLENMPKTIVELAPATEPFRVARIVNMVVIVDPQTRRVVEVISGKAL